MRSLISLFCLIVWLCPRAAAQHAHINAGADYLGADIPPVGSRLMFVNGPIFSTNSGYAHPLYFAKSGPYAGLNVGSVTFTALPATVDAGGPAYNHAALGSVLYLQILSAEGPSGGTFSFWQEDEFAGTTDVLFTIPVGATNGTNRILLSESSGAPGEDPYGHIHGRVFTADKPGLYTLGLQLFDVSSNGPGGEPYHQPSQPLFVHFQAGVTILSVTKSNSVARIDFGSQNGVTYYLEGTPALGGTNEWRLLDGPVQGHNDIHFLHDFNASSQQMFYRLRTTQ